MPRDFLGEAIARELRRKASKDTRSVPRSAPRVRGLPEHEVPPCAPAWTQNLVLVKFMREVFGYTWTAPAPPPPDAEPPRIKDNAKREAFRTDVSAACNRSFKFTYDEPAE